MKTSVLQIIRVTVTFLLVAAMISGLGYILRPVDTDLCFDTIEAFHNLPEDTLEVIGFGSSHMWRGMDPGVMYRDYGIGAYNYGCNWQKLNTTSLFIHDALQTQSPKVILIETFYLNALHTNVDMDGEIYYTRAIPESPAKQRYLQQCFGEERNRYLCYYMPFGAFHDNWVNLSQQSFEPPSEGRILTTPLGFVGSDICVPVTLPEPEDLPQSPLRPEVVEELDYIVAMCREKNVEIIFYTAPFAYETFPFTSADATRAYAEANGYPYINFFELQEEIRIDSNTDFSDAGHLNSSGAAKVSSFLGRYLAENYDLTDMRTVDNSIWK